jgi:YD repeat-containing protein
LTERDKNKSVKYNKMDVDDVIFYFKELQENTFVNRSMSLKDEIQKVNIDEISFLDDGGRTIRFQYWQYGKLGARRLVKQTCYPLHVIYMYTVMDKNKNY